MIKRLNVRLALLLTLVLLIVPFFAARAQTPAGDGISDAELGESAEAVRELRDIKNKTLIFVFDISGSMRGDDLTRAREATVTILREGTGAGDRVVLMTFGAGYRTVFDRTLASEGDKDELLEQVPADVGEGAGTNIRKPHHDALKILDAALPKPGAVILLTDSLNDEPRRDDPAYPTYLKYYTPGGRLNKFPDTPENRDYERLLQKVQKSQKVKIYGIGVQIDQNGRPVERLPKQAPDIPPPTQPIIPAETTVRKEPGFPWLWVALGAGALLLALFLLLPPLFKATALRISGGPAGPKDFQVKAGGTVRIGGDGASFAHDAYPIPGVAAAPAVIKGARGAFVLSPGALQTPGVEPPKVYHNGLLLEKETALNYGDEVRVSVPDPSGMAKDYRLKFEDPKQSY